MSVKCVLDHVADLLSLVECLAWGRQTVCHTGDDKRDRSEARLLIDFRKTRWLHTKTHILTLPHTRIYKSHLLLCLCSRILFPEGNVLLSGELGHTRIGYMRNSLLTPEVMAGLTRCSACRNKTWIINAVVLRFYIYSPSMTYSVEAMKRD